VDVASDPDIRLTAGTYGLDLSRAKKLKGMTQPPLPHPLQLIVVALSVASLSFNDKQAEPPFPLQPLYYFKATPVHWQCVCQRFWPAQVGVTGVIQ